MPADPSAQGAREDRPLALALSLQQAAHPQPKRTGRSDRFCYVQRISNESGMNAVAAPEKKPKRKRSGTAKWHMSREAVSMPLDELYKMDEPACWKFFVE